MASKDAWGRVLSGRMLPVKVVAEFGTRAWQAVMGRADAKGRASRLLTKSYAWGPGTDLQAYAFIRFIGTWDRWMRRSHKVFASRDEFNSAPLLGLPDVFWKLGLGI